jgi:hypothetical protein
LISTTNLDDIHAPKLALSLPLFERRFLLFTRDCITCVIVTVLAEVTNQRPLTGGFAHKISYRVVYAVLTSRSQN